MRHGHNEARFEHKPAVTHPYNSYTQPFTTSAPLQPQHTKALLPPKQPRSSWLSLLLPPHLYSLFMATGLPMRHSVLRRGKVDSGSRSCRWQAETARHSILLSQFEQHCCAWALVDSCNVETLAGWKTARDAQAGGCRTLSVPTAPSSPPPKHTLAARPLSQQGPSCSP
jgi:hypothetical protein